MRNAYCQRRYLTNRNPDSHRSQDLDGHVWELMWFDPVAAQKAMSEQPKQ
jgi:hypothetical protein